MLSKIVEGADARNAGKIAWRKLGPDTAGASTERAGSGHKVPDAAALETRIAQLQAEITAREAQARRVGFQEGETAARKTLEAPYRQAIAQLAAQAGELAGLKRRVRREAEEDLVKLAVAIARRILRRELSADPEAILGLVKAALGRVEGREILRLRVHPDDASTLRACLGELGLPDRVEVAADPKRERGAFIVETSRGDLDASAETQLQEIERGFADIVRRQP